MEQRRDAWYAAKPAPSTKMPTAASKDQKYLAIP